MDRPLKYLSKPQEVEAIQHDGTTHTINRIVEWVRSEGQHADVPKNRFGAIYIVTDSGSYQLWTDWFIVKTGPRMFEVYDEENFHRNFTPKRS